MLRERLKILFLPAWYPNEENPVEGIFIKEFAQAVSLYNDVIVMYARRSKYLIKKRFIVFSDKKENGIRTIRIYYKPFSINKLSYPVYLHVIKEVFKKIFKDEPPDIINAHVFSAGVPAVILGRLYKIPVVITEHWSGFIRKSIKFKDLLKIRFAMNRANIVLPVSKLLQKAISDYGIKNKFLVIPNVVNTKIFYPVRISSNKCAAKKILFVGLLTPAKGIAYLLKSIAVLKNKRKDFVLQIVGDGPYRKMYENMVIELGIQKFVNFYGLKTKNEVAKFMQNCTFFVTPSIYETFNVTCIEAMACGKPVVATTLDVFKEKINRERGVLVPPKNSKALADALNFMLDNYQCYSPIEISRYVIRNFSYESVGKKLDKIYRGVKGIH